MVSLQKVGRYYLLTVVCLSVALSVALSVVVFYALLGQVHSGPYSVTTSILQQTVPFKVFCSENLDYSALAQVLSKELMVRRVYFDPRKRNGYANTTVFLMEAKGTSINFKRFHGCRVGHSFSDRFRFRTPVNYKWVQTHKHTTSTLALIDCYNVPRVENGDLASLYYNTSTGVVVEVLSQKPLFVPEPRAALNPPTVTAVVCVGMIRTGEHPPSHHGMLYHWLRYQKTIGVDHVHMIIEDSFVRYGGLRHEVILQAAMEGYLSIDYWPNWLNYTEVYNSQKLAYQDCLYRFQGIYDYIVYADSDDFFVPLKKSKSIKDYLRTWCSGTSGTCCFSWHEFYPDCGWNASFIGEDGNFTAAMTYKKIVKMRQAKSAHQLKALVDAGTHYAMILLKGYRQAIVPAREAYFAHLRFGRLPKGGCK